MTVKDHIKVSLETMAKDPMVRFVGYNLCPAGGSSAGTLKDVPQNQIEEMPLAECLMSGVAVGLSLAGFLPVLVYERMDFIFHGLDAIVNHLGRIAQLSDGIHRPACIIRCTVGNSRVPLFTEPTHVADYSRAMREMVDFPVVRLKWINSIQHEYYSAYMRMKNERISTILVDYKDDHNNTE